MTDMNQQTEQVQEYTNSMDAQPNKKPKKQRMSKGNLARYGVVATLVIALVVLVSLLLQSRSEAQADSSTAEHSTSMEEASAAPQRYVPSQLLQESDANMAQEGVTQNNVAQDNETQESVTVPEVALVPSNVSQESAESLIPTPTPSSNVSSEVAPSGQSPLGQRTEVGIVRGRGSALMDSPDGQVVETLPTGNAVTAIARSADSLWLYVTTPEGKSGWLSMGQVLIYHVENLAVMETAAVTNATQSNTTSSQPTTAPVFQDGEIAATVALNGSRLNVRSGPGTNYAVVGKAEPNEVFLAVARNNAGTWVQIELADAPNQIAWVSANFITLTSSLQDLPVSQQVGSEPQANTVSPAVSAQVAVNTSSSTSVPTGTGMQGNLVIQSGNGGTLYVYNLSTGAMRALTSGFDPAVSPDGQTVAFARGGGENGLYLIEIDGTNERRIFSGGEEIAAPSWSPDNQWLVFRRSVGSYKCREVGFGICIPDNSPFLDGFPLGSGPQHGLSVVDRNGENFHDVNSLTLSQTPDWNEAGIVYASHPSIEITADEPGLTTQRVVAEPFYQDPDWQPNGGRIVFQSKRGNHWEIFAVNSDGSGLGALTKPVTALVDELPDNVAPAWSPDGQYIVYLSSRDDDNEQGKWRLWVMNADGSNQHPLPVDLEIQYNYANEQAVSWGV